MLSRPGRDIKHEHPPRENWQDECLCSGGYENRRLKISARHFLQCSPTKCVTIARCYIVTLYEGQAINATFRQAVASISSKSGKCIDGIAELTLPEHHSQYICLKPDSFYSQNDF